LRIKSLGDFALIEADERPAVAISTSATTREKLILSRTSHRHALAGTPNAKHRHIGLGTREPSAQAEPAAAQAAGPFLFL